MSDLTGSAGSAGPHRLGYGCIECGEADLPFPDHVCAAVARTRPEAGTGTPEAREAGKTALVKPRVACVVEASTEESRAIGERMRDDLIARGFDGDADEMVRPWLDPDPAVETWRDLLSTSREDV